MLDFASDSTARRMAHFAEVARTGHFGRASVRLGISQPALTRCIQALERDVGVPLLRRHAKGVDLTAEGASVLALCSTIQKSMDRIRSGAVTTGAKSVVAIGISPALSPLLTPRLFAALSRAWPAVRLDFAEADCDAVERDLLDHTLDLALLYDPTETVRLATIPLAQERLVFICSPQFDLAVLPRPLRLADLRRLPVILPGPGQRARRLIQRAERAAGFTLQPILETHSMATTRALVHDGLGVTVATEQSAAAELRRGALQCRPIEGAGLVTTLHLARRAEASELPAGLAEAVAAIVLEMAQSAEWPGASIRAG